MDLSCMNVRNHEIGSGSGMEATDMAVALRLFLSALYLLYLEGFL